MEQKALVRRIVLLSQLTILADPRMTSAKTYWESTPCDVKSIRADPVTIILTPKVYHSGRCVSKRVQIITYPL